MFYTGLVVLISLPTLASFYTDDHLSGTFDDGTLGLSLNDDFIIPNPNPPCPDLSILDCSAEVHLVQRRDALIHATTKITTRQPLFTTTPIQILPVTTVPYSPAEGRPCDDEDDEECDQSGDYYEAGPNIDPSTPHQTEQTIPLEGSNPIVLPYEPDGGPTDPHVHPDIDQSGASEYLPEIRPPDIHQTQANIGPSSLTTSQTMSPSDRDKIRKVSTYDQQNIRLTLNMNIILIVGIAAGVVILLLILIVAVCMYIGRTSASRKGSKIDRYGGGAGMGGAVGSVGLKGYAYEACNTLPPHLAESQHPGVVQYPPAMAPMSAQHPASTTTLSPIKSSNKDVKEWYV